MKRAILLAALLGLAPSAANAADTTPPAQLFNIVTPSAGNVVFSGAGTASFNNSIGTNNNFNVGSSTNLGVNASASSTTDYTASGSGLLQLAGTSTLQQTIGTATAAFNTATVTAAANEAATTATNGSKWGASYDASYSYGAGVDSQASWKAGWDAEYKSTYSNVIANSSTTSSTTNGGASQSGTISANFKTTETGATTQDITKQKQDAAAAVAYGATYSSSNTYGDNGTALSESAWKGKYDVAYAAAYENANAAASASTQRTSVSEVTVQGIGVIANVNAGPTSLFKADSGKLVASADGTNGNANASSGTSLSTSSFATQSNTTNASAFMQAFGTKQATETVTTP